MMSHVCHCEQGYDVPECHVTLAPGAECEGNAFGYVQCMSVYLSLKTIAQIDTYKYLNSHYKTPPERFFKKNGERTRGREDTSRNISKNGLG